MRRCEDSDHEPIDPCKIADDLKRQINGLLDARLTGHISEDEYADRAYVESVPGNPYYTTVFLDDLPLISWPVESEMPHYFRGLIQEHEHPALPPMEGEGV